ncbi:MAG TPA: hypothetical protein VF530_15090 [Planctomycetota bacterium]
MNEVREEVLPRILGRRLALEQSIQQFEEQHGDESARPTYTLRYPPDRDRN